MTPRKTHSATSISSEKTTQSSDTAEQIKTKGEEILSKKKPSQTSKHNAPPQTTEQAAGSTKHSASHQPDKADATAQAAAIERGATEIRGMEAVAVLLRDGSHLRADQEQPSAVRWGERLLLGMLIFVPIGAWLHFATRRYILTFVVCCLAIVPLAGYMGKATEMLAHRMGSGLGGLMNAAFGNAAELLIAIMALRKGNLLLVKASIAGSIIGNLLFVLGLSIFLGGLRREKQSFNLTAASASTSLLLISAFALVIPALFHAVIPAAKLASVERSLSVVIALILLGLYVLSLVFSLKTHSHLFSEEEGDTHEEVLEWSVGKSVAILLIATAFVGVMAEFLLHALEHSVKDLGLSVAFVGVIIVALIGNAAEHSTAVVVALKNKMNLSFTIAVESSKQIALFVAPVLVLLGLWFGPNAKGEWMNLDFGLMEVAGVLLSVMIVANISHDGESNWLEGAMLLGVYAILAAGFFFLP